MIIDLVASAGGTEKCPSDLNIPPPRLNGILTVKISPVQLRGGKKLPVLSNQFRGDGNY